MSDGDGSDLALRPVAEASQDAGANHKPALTVRFRLRLSVGIEVGPGKIELLALIAETGSISEAARRMQMSYRRAWLLVDSMNKALPQPVVISAAGGRRGGGAQLTPFARDLIARYHDLQSEIDRMAAARFAPLIAAGS